MQSGVSSSIGCHSRNAPSCFVAPMIIVAALAHRSSPPSTPPHCSATHDRRRRRHVISSRGTSLRIAIVYSRFVLFYFYSSTLQRHESTQLVDSVLSVTRRGPRVGPVLLAMSEVDRVAQQFSRFTIDLASTYRLRVIETTYKFRQRLSTTTNSDYQLLITNPLQHVFHTQLYSPKHGRYKVQI